MSETVQPWLTFLSEDYCLVTGMRHDLCVCVQDLYSLVSDDV